MQAPLYTGAHRRPFGRVHHLYMASKFRQIRRLPKPRLRRTYLRAWRNHHDLSLERVAERLKEVHGVEMTHASLSRIERGLQPYSQRQLEALAVEYKTEPASLLMRDPKDPEGIWSVWDHAKSGQRATIVEIAKTVLKTGT